MGRSSNRHRNTVTSGYPREVYVPARTTDGVNHPVETRLMPDSPIYTGEGTVTLDNNGEIVLIDGQHYD